MASGSTRPKLIAIVGPTASGKSELAMKIAKHYDGEIIAADSRTIYRGMDIATAKPTRRDQRRVPHHLIDIVNPGQRFSVGEFKMLAKSAIDDIQSRGKLPILVGGTGLYIDSVLFDYQFDQGSEKDPINPRHKLARGIDRSKPPATGSLIVGIMPDKSDLESRIKTRAEAMIQAGLLDEVSRLLKDYPAELEVFKTPGYQPFIKYLEGDIGLDEAEALFVQGDQQLAKKQRTWFKRNRHIEWFDNVSGAYDYLANLLTTNK